MRFSDSISSHPDADNIRRIMRENDHGTKKFWVIKMPCGHGSVEITKPEDQWLTCKKCLQSFLLTWSPIEANRKIAQADDARTDYLDLRPIDIKGLRF